MFLLLPSGRKYPLQRPRVPGPRRTFWRMQKFSREIVRPLLLKTEKFKIEALRRIDKLPPARYDDRQLHSAGLWRRAKGDDRDKTGGAKPREGAAGGKLP